MSKPNSKPAGRRRAMPKDPPKLCIVPPITPTEQPPVEPPSMGVMMSDVIEGRAEDSAEGRRDDDKGVLMND